MNSQRNRTGIQMPGKMMIYLALAAAVTVGYYGWKLTARNAYEAAEYSVIEADGPYELRQYSTLTMATTSMRFASRGEDGSFMRLFQYISGGNERKQKVAMTVPVFMERKDSSTGQMGFVVPKAVAEQEAPAPTDENVWIQKREGGRYAVVRFAGRMDDAARELAEKRLRTWMREEGHADAGDGPEYAGYDPPWTPGPLRRNEVLIRLK